MDSFIFEDRRSAFRDTTGAFSSWGICTVYCPGRVCKQTVGGERDHDIYSSLTGHSINLLKLTAGAQRHRHHVPSEFLRLESFKAPVVTPHPLGVADATDFRHGHPTRGEARVDGSREHGRFSAILSFNASSHIYTVRVVSHQLGSRNPKIHMPSTKLDASLMTCETPGVHAVRRRQAMKQQ